MEKEKSLATAALRICPSEQNAKLTKKVKNTNDVQQNVMTAGVGTQVISVLRHVWMHRH